MLKVVLLSYVHSIVSQVRFAFFTEGSDESRLIPVDHTAHQSDEEMKFSEDLEKEIEKNLDILHKQFINLLGQLKRELKANISLEDIIDFINDNMLAEEDFSNSRDFEHLMNKLRGYYNFLDCSIILDLAEKFARPDLSQKLETHSQEAKAFRVSHPVKTLTGRLKKIFLPYIKNMSDAPHSIIDLNNAWSDAAIERLKILMIGFFPKEKRQSLLNHIDVIWSSIHIVYYMTEDPAEIQQIIAHVQDKVLFMRLVGIYGFAINGQSILNESEDKTFTFELGLLNSTVECHTEAVQFLLEMCDVNCQRKDGATALMLASQKGHSDIVKILLTKNPHINTQGETGWTAFMLASRYNHVDVVKLLLERNLDINMQKPDGWTALMLASYLGHDEVVRLLLLQDKTFVNMQNNDGWTALMLAIQSYHDLPVKYLLTKQQADLNLQNNKGMTALMLASVIGNFQVVELLLERHVDSNIHSPHGMTALTITILYTEYYLKYTDIDKNILILSVVQRKSNYMKCLKLLFDKQTSPFFITSSGEELPLLLLATLSRNMDAIKIIMEKWPAQNEDILKAVVGACYLGHSEVITFLSDKLPHLTSEDKQLLVSCAEGDLGAIVTALATGLNPDTSLVGGFTLLMIASSCGHNELVDAFIQSGADVDKVNDDGCTVFDILEETVMNKQEDIVSLLHQHKDSSDVTVPKQPDTSTETQPAKIDQKAPTVKPEEVSTLRPQEQQTTPSPTVEPTTHDIDSKVQYEVSTKPDVVSKPIPKEPIIEISMFELIVLLRQQLPEVFDNTHTQPSNPYQSCYTEHPQTFLPPMITT